MFKTHNYLFNSSNILVEKRYENQNNSWLGHWILKFGTYLKFGHWDL